uniref:Uncharacterized protein n=1 Tax=Siphoviridae sp. ct16C7 TaxID=2825304 RepID=A0A8S5NYA3_9CAUD|nr:MAG TPA: hypothetical protein [Siphoviridae sp. ct16C7]
MAYGKAQSKNKARRSDSSRGLFCIHLTDR